MICVHRIVDGWKKEKMAWLCNDQDENCANEKKSKSKKMLSLRKRRCCPPVGVCMMPEAVIRISIRKNPLCPAVSHDAFVIK